MKITLNVSVFGRNFCGKSKLITDLTGRPECSEPTTGLQLDSYTANETKVLLTEVGNIKLFKSVACDVVKRSNVVIYCLSPEDLSNEELLDKYFMEALNKSFLKQKLFIVLTKSDLLQEPLLKEKVIKKLKETQRVANVNVFFSGRNATVHNKPEIKELKTELNNIATEIKAKAFSVLGDLKSKDILEIYKNQRPSSFRRFLYLRIIGAIFGKERLLRSLEKRSFKRCGKGASSETLNVIRNRFTL